MNPKVRLILGLAGGGAIFLSIALFGHLDPENPKVTYTMAITVLMALWWIFEVLPLAVTALLPVILFPFFGIVDGKQISSSYFNDIIFLFMGGFMVALAMQKWNLHKRIALYILRITGVSPAMILLGFMLATSLLSMWISNTATAMMMIPIAISIISQLEQSFGAEKVKKYSIGLLLAIAYSASVGGTATLVGTPPNLAFAKIFSISFPNAPEISFGQWMIFALPLAIVFLGIVWVYLYFVFCRDDSMKVATGNEITVKDQLKKLGKIKFEEKIVLTAFILFAILLIFRSDIVIGSFKIPGWSNLFPNPTFINDGTVAIGIGIILFLIPSRKHHDHILDWDTARSMPWRIIILFGGGFALAKGFVESGLSEWIGQSLKSVTDLHPVIIIASITTVMIFLTEVTSNTATTQMILPILAAISVSTRINPLLFMIPATIAGSMAFMLPVATPPNAIIFGTDRIRIADMAKTGFLLNLIGIIFITLAVWFYGRYIFAIDLTQLPDWVKFN